MIDVERMVTGDEQPSPLLIGNAEGRFGWLTATGSIEQATLQAPTRAFEAPWCAVGALIHDRDWVVVDFAKTAEMIGRRIGMPVLKVATRSVLEGANPSHAAMVFGAKPRPNNEGPQYGCEWAGGPGRCPEPSDGFSENDDIQHPLCVAHLAPALHPRSLWNNLHAGQPITKPCSHVAVFRLPRSQEGNRG